MRWSTRRMTIFIAAVMTVLAAWLAWAAPASAAAASVVYKGPSDRKQIALTFDDNTKVAPALATLRALQKNDVPATLFVIGSSVKATPGINTEIIKGMKQGLFEVGDHTWSHPDLTGLTTSAMGSQIGGGTDAFRATTGARTVPLFRPPYGSMDSRVAAVAGGEGFTHVVLWDVDPRDWAGGSAGSIANHVISHAHNGAIVVMHLSAPHTAAAIPIITGELRGKGYEFVTVSTMLRGDRLFLDVDGASSAGQAIGRMVGEKFMSGYDGNYFGPGDGITRAQVAKVATLVGGLHTPEVERAGSPSFADVPLLHDPQGNPLAYPFDYVEEAVAAGLVVGSLDPGGTMVFRPTEAVTRVQLAQILARMARQLKGYGREDAPDVSGAATPVFADVPAYAAEDVALVAALGLMSGYSSDRFDPWPAAQRGHVAVVMSRYLDLPALDLPPARSDPGPQEATAPGR